MAICTSGLLLLKAPSVIVQSMVEMIYYHYCNLNTTGACPTGYKGQCLGNPLDDAPTDTADRHIARNERED